MPEDPLLDSVWNALHTVHAHFALRNSLAVRYPADVVPFAAMANADHSDLSPLAQLLAPAELVYLIGAQPQATKNLQVGPALDCFQMLFRAVPHANAAAESAASAAPTDTPILRMTPADAPAMFALTDLAFPGFFRPRTHEMGTYYGIRINDELAAMAGERIAVPGFREISAVVTHPAHTGKGYATVLMNRLLQDHAATGLKSFLHVSEHNSRAIAIYKRLGFVVLRSFALWPISLIP
jgi:ribosomal protein S18 acetylase RimI-like enzyme